MHTSCLKSVRHRRDNIRPGMTLPTDSQFTPRTNKSNCMTDVLGLRKVKQVVRSRSNGTSCSRGVTSCLQWE